MTYGIVFVFLFGTLTLILWLKGGHLHPYNWYYEEIIAATGLMMAWPNKGKEIFIML